MKLLKNHTSPETAYQVDDYPYGYTLRCKIRYWLEYSPKKGFRFVSQTTNPKRGNAEWNKPKASTYCRFGGAMFLDDNGHVQWSGLSEYTDGKEAKAWSDTFRDGVPSDGLVALDKWVAAKIAYDAARAAKKAEGEIPPLHVGLVEARAAFAATARRIIRVYHRNSLSDVWELIATHDNVPRDWTHREVIERFGIAEHLQVRDGDENDAGNIIQAGQTRIA